MLLVVGSLTAGVSGIAASQGQEDGPSDAVIESGEVFWQGQFLELSAGEENGGDVWEIREASGGETGSLVTQLQLDSSGSAVVGTDNLAGEYVVVDENGDPVAFENGTATPGASVDEAAWEVAEQELAASFEAVAVNNGDGVDSQTDLQVESNRADYRFYLFSDDLSASQLADIFSDVELRNDRAVANRSVGTSDAFEANFTGVSAGTYNITVAATDGTARDTTTIDVSDPTEGSASLANATVSDHRGDVARFNVTFDGANQTTVALGSEDVGYLSQFTVADEDGDGEATVRVNTYREGLSADEPGISAAGEDRVTDYQLRTEPLSGPLDAATYPIRLFVGGSQTETGTMVLNEPSVEGVQVWTAPGSTNPGSASEVAEVAAQTDNVAQGDWAIVQIDASGLSGYVDDVSDLNSNETGLSMELTRGMEMNVPEEEVPLDQATLFEDEENDQLFLVFDSSDLDADASYQANFTVTEANPYVSAENASSYTANFSVVDRNVTIDEPVEVPASSDATVSGTSTVAPGTELTVEIENTAASPFFDRQTATVSEDGTWEASFDLSGVPNGTEFNVTVPEPEANATGVVIEDAEGAEETTTEAEDTAEETDEAETTAEETEEEADAGAAGDEEETETDEEADAADEEETDEEATEAGDEETETPPETETTEEEEDVASANTPGFGPVTLVLAALVALAGVAVALRRR